MKLIKFLGDADESCFNDVSQDFLLHKSSVCQKLLIFSSLFHYSTQRYLRNRYTLITIHKVQIKPKSRLGSHRFTQTTTFTFLDIIYLYVFNIIFQVTHMPWKKMPLQLLNVALNLWSMPANVELAIIVSLGVVIK